MRLSIASLFLLFGLFVHGQNIQINTSSSTFSLDGMEYVYSSGVLDDLPAPSRGVYVRGLLPTHSVCPTPGACSNAFRAEIGEDNVLQVYLNHSFPVFVKELIITDGVVATLAQPNAGRVRYHGTTIDWTNAMGEDNREFLNVDQTEALYRGFGFLPLPSPKSIAYTAELTGSIDNQIYRLRTIFTRI